jgi:hypothetical protein
VPNILTAGSVTTSSLTLSGLDLAAELAARERSFVATLPLRKTVILGVQTLEIDETQTLVASGFQSGPFRLHSSDDSVLRVLRQTSSGLQTLAQLRWDTHGGVAGGSLGVNRIQANGAVEVAFGDKILAEQGLRVQGDLHITGNVSCDGTLPSPIFCSGSFAGNGTRMAFAGVAFTIVRQSAGVYRVTFATPHPQGIGFAVSLTAQGGSTWSGFIVASVERIDASSFRINHQNQSGSRVDVEGNFVVFN